MSALAGPLYPVGLVVAGRACLVVGGGAVAARKVDGLLACGARVTVVAPQVGAPIAARAATGAEAFASSGGRTAAGEAASYRLVITATGDPAVDRQVFDDAEAAGVWVNAADQPARCSFTCRRWSAAAPSPWRSPPTAPARRWRAGCATAWPRPCPTISTRSWPFWLPPASGCRPSGRSTEDHDWRSEIHEPLDRRSRRRMTVHLVGAGPGDPELLTVRAARLLAGADVVVHDRLAELATALANPAAELIDVGKRPGLPYPQEAINALLVQLGREDREVVRLKGGDPFVFGRGGEEALALAAAGVPFTVVPGVSSALAAPAAAGVPVTHRGLAAARHGGDRPPRARRGRRRLGGAGPRRRHDRRAHGRGPARRRSPPRSRPAGWPPARPVAAVRGATRPDQEVVRCRLDELGQAAVEAPATIVIGAVAALDVTAPRRASERASTERANRGRADQRKRRSRRLLVTTNTLEQAMAAPAISGLSSPAAASGMAATL